jgi:anti-sigma factor RsiW
VTCREFTEFLDAYVGGTLSAAQRAEFDGHLASCKACVAYLESYRRTIELARNARRDEGAAPQEAPEELVRAILAARKRQP